VAVKRIFSSLVTALFLVVFCLAAVCDLDCSMARDLAPPAQAHESMPGMGQQPARQEHCAQCRHCAQPQGYTAQAGAALSHLNFYLPQSREELSRAASPSRGSVQFRFSSGVSVSAARSGVGEPVAAFPGADKSAPGSLSLILRI